jgi:hypothetical protein
MSEVLHIELAGERFIDVIAGFVDAENENVVNIYGDEDTVIAVVVDAGVGVETFEADAEDIIAKE